MRTAPHEFSRLSFRSLDRQTQSHHSCIDNPKFSKVHFRHKNFEFIAEKIKSQESTGGFSTASLFKLYFCLDTSLNRTLAYDHWCNWGVVLQGVSACSQFWCDGGIVSAASASAQGWISLSFKRTDSADHFESVVGGIVYPPGSIQLFPDCSSREVACRISLAF
jgi:hypothetical protein